MKICKLKNGAVVPQQVVVSLLINLKHLMRSGDIDKILLVYEIAKKAADPKHEIFSSQISKNLKDLNLLNSDETLIQTNADIINSAITFEDEMPLIGNPVLETYEI